MHLHVCIYVRMPACLPALTTEYTDYNQEREKTTIVYKPFPIFISHTRTAHKNKRESQRKGHIIKFLPSNYK